MIRRAEMDCSVDPTGVLRSDIMTTAQILPGLPPYGPMATSFPRPNAASEGLVIEFANTPEDRWIGNFARGFGDFDDVRTELGAGAIIIIASGSGYVVDARSRHLVREFSGAVSGIWYRDQPSSMIATNGLWFEAFNAIGLLWKSRRISWDGVRGVELSTDAIRGEAFLADF